ncbi:unnamed protein product, partial [Ectocarpus fasciculatus]
RLGSRARARARARTEFHLVLSAEHVSSVLAVATEAELVRYCPLSVNMFFGVAPPKQQCPKLINHTSVLSGNLRRDERDRQTARTAATIVIREQMALRRSDASGNVCNPG